MKNFAYVMDKDVWNIMRTSILDYLKMYSNSFKFEPSECYDRIHVEFYDVIDDMTENNIDGFYNEAVEIANIISDFLEF